MIENRPKILNLINKLNKNKVDKDVYSTFVDSIDKKVDDNSNLIEEIANNEVRVELVEQTTKSTIDKYIEDGTIANLTIEDNSIETVKYKDESITEPKLGNDILDSVESLLYEKAILIDLTKSEELIKGKIENNIPIEDDSGNVYFTPYVKVSDYESLTLMVEKPTPYIRFYDMSKSYIEGKYALGIISSIMPENCVYIVIQGNLSERYGYYYLSYNKKQEYKNLKLNSKGTSLYSKKEETKETDEVGTKTNLIPIIKGETYTFEAGGNGAIEFYNSSGIKITKSLPHLNPVEGARYKWTITIPLETDITHVTFLGYNSKKATLTGFFIEEKNTNFELKLIEENFDLDIIISLRKLLNIGAGTGGTFYNVLDYGVSELSEDNSAALQIAIDEVNAQGGGILWIPKGTYNFKSSRVQVNNGNMEAAVWAKSKVSIIGESLSGTVLKMIGDSANGTKGCGSICAVDSNLNLLDIGDGDESSLLTYENASATMKDVPEVNYE